MAGAQSLDRALVIDDEIGATIGACLLLGIAAHLHAASETMEDGDGGGLWWRRMKMEKERNAGAIDEP